MADSPDLSKIVGLIMEHPEIVGQITALLNGTEGESEPTEAKKPEESTPVSKKVTERRSDRARLLGAMKPYLSPGRAQAVDTMITVAEILENMRRGG